jgi:hypothetical protein
LAEKYCGERGFGVEPVVGEQPQRFQGVVGQEVTLVDAQNGHPAPFGCFGGQRVTGLPAGRRRMLAEIGRRSTNQALQGTVTLVSVGVLGGSVG